MTHDAAAEASYSQELAASSSNKVEVVDDDHGGKNACLCLEELMAKSYFIINHTHLLL